MEEIFKLENVSQYNTLMGQETLHPLVSVINCSNSGMIQYMRMNLGFYAIFLKDVKCGDMRYGRKNYDYQKDTLVFVSPGQVIGFDNIVYSIFCFIIYLTIKFNTYIKHIIPYFYLEYIIFY